MPVPSVQGNTRISEAAERKRDMPGIFQNTVLEAKRVEFVDDALIHAKSLCEKLEISFELLRRIRNQAPQDINEDFQLERVRLQAFVAATEPVCKKELIRSGSLGLLKYVIESKLEDG
ncbi:uncharacterized protein TNCV_1088821 [Trichonephila clavipes]|uniref:Uncharacterized protein n=1 Tax=Trichonephila clavipes TaxID=2585209 RepID=A0A8X6SZC5_TRICX|nr:uncharacterized protein TNCV_1088821 [Trichonephila clavipes]